MPVHAPFLLLVMLVVGTDDGDTSDAAARAARATLPAASRVEVKRASAADDPSALAAERTANADGVAIVSFEEKAHKRVRLRVHRRVDDTWLDREITFQSADKPEERARTVGFALASMFAETNAPDPDRAPPASDAATTPSIAPVAPGPVPAPLAREEPTRDERSRAARAVLDAAAIGAVGIAGYGGGIGGRAGGGWIFAPRATLRLDASFRRAEVAPAQATSLVVTAGPGIAFDVIEATAPSRVGLAVRLNGLALFHAQNHLSDEPEPVTASRWLPGASAALDASLRLSDSAAVLLGGGTECAFGRTDVYLHGRRVAVVPPVRLLADLGVRVRF